MDLILPSARANFAFLLYPRHIRMKTKTPTTQVKMEFEPPEIEIISIQTSANFLTSNEPPQNENTYEEDLF